MKTLNLQNTVLALCLCTCLSCKKFVEIMPAPNLLESKNVFSNDQAATSAVVGLYAQMRTTSLSLLNGGISVYTGLSGDEIYNTSVSTAYDPFALNALTPTNGTATAFWTTAYTSIYQANAILEGLAGSTTVTDSVKTQLMGEMRFIRALYYFQLVNLFGDVPLVTTTDYRVNQSLPRSGTAQMYLQIVDDLQEAIRLLKATYPSANRARPNKWTAVALLARVHLFLKNWPEAEAAATAIITSGSYSLVSAPANVFTISSNETIYQLASDNSNTADGASYIPSSTTVKPTFAVTSVLLNGFEASDTRKSAWLSSNVVSGTAYYYPAKYKARVSTPVTEYEVVFRLAEQYLIRAEARAQQGKLTEGKADVNLIRARAGLSGTVANDIPALLTVIERERQLELFCEWGHRWYDLKRTARIDAVLSAVKQSNWQPTDALYPVPQSQIELNPYLTQNPGY